MININIRIDEQLKKDTEVILDSLGLTISDAVRIYFSQIRNTRSIPFMLKSNEEPQGKD